MFARARAQERPGRWAPVLLAACALAGCGGGPGTLEEVEIVGRASLVDTEGRPAGSVSLRRGDAGLIVRARVQGLQPGFHGFHVHEVGACDPNAREGAERSPFASAGEHLARGDAVHGDHAGDLPPVLAGEDGEAFYTVSTERLTIEQLTEGDRTAFVVHAEPDNVAHVPERYSSDRGRGGGPDRRTLRTGDSGVRVACGEIRRVPESQ